MSQNRSTKLKAKNALSNLRGDYSNIVFLLLLYVLQGIPLGLSSAIPLLLQNRKVSYSDQALFSFVTWPFSLKLLWAPIVDSVYSRHLGRRKSWLIPTQLGIGIFMLILSQSIESLIPSDPKSTIVPDIRVLTAVFLVLNFLAATQDIAVDGWALTMLKRRNIGYASTCNTAGQTAGFFIGNVIFLALESADFSNKYLRSEANQSTKGIITLEKFLNNFGISFIVITLLVAIIKRESNSYDSETAELKLKSNARRSDNDASQDKIIENELSVKETYSVLGKIMNLSSFKLFALVSLTYKIGFSAPDAVSGLKLVEAGVHKENLAMLAVPMVPLQIVLPWIISRITCGPRPLDLLTQAYPFRLLFGIVFPIVVYITPMLKLNDGTFPTYFYIMLVAIYCLHQITVYSIFVASMAFHASVSDPKIGGTYMTLLNTIANLGGNWPSTLSLWLVDMLSFSSCSQVCPISEANSTLNNHTGESTSNCENKCVTTVDGYYIECALCVVIGFIWLYGWGASKIRKLQSLPSAAWTVTSNKAL